VLPDGSTASEVVAPDGSVVFDAGPEIPDSVVSRENDDQSFDQTVREGFEIEVKSDWQSIGARLSNLTSGLTVAYLQDSNGSNIDTVDITGLTSGDAFTFNNVNLLSGNKYRIVADAEGSTFTEGLRNVSNYPYTSNDVDITNRVFDGALDQANVAILNDIGNTGFD